MGISKHPHIIRKMRPVTSRSCDSGKRSWKTSRSPRIGKFRRVRAYRDSPFQSLRSCPERARDLLGRRRPDSPGNTMPRDSIGIAPPSRIGIRSRLDAPSSPPLPSFGVPRKGASRPRGNFFWARSWTKGKRYLINGLQKALRSERVWPGNRVSIAPPLGHGERNILIDRRGRWTGGGDFGGTKLQRYGKRFARPPWPGRGRGPRDGRRPSIPISWANPIRPR